MELSWNEIGVIRLALEAHAEKLRNIYEEEPSFEHSALPYEVLALRLKDWANQDSTDAVDYVLKSKPLLELKEEIDKIERELYGIPDPYRNRNSSPGL